MRHIFRATKIGWDKEQEIIWFDAAQYSEKEAHKQFKKYKGKTQQGFSYTGYEYGGQKYHDVSYFGVCEDDKMPKNEIDLLRLLSGKKKKK